LLALITNDDGIHAPGIAALEEAARSVFEEVAVVAPRSQRSAASHAITLRRCLRLEKLAETRWSLDATPADCVFFALRELLQRTPDVVLSGVNLGPNLGYDTLYSGTVAAAREGIMSGIPSLAFSLAVTRDTDFSQVLDPVKTVLQRFRRLGLPPETMLNVNIPSLEQFGPPKGYRSCTLGRRVFENRTSIYEDPMGELHGWIGGREFRLDGDEHSDCRWLKEGFVTLSALTWNLACANVPWLDGWEAD
jgi:5'-nucleotidase